MALADFAGGSARTLEHILAQRKADQALKFIQARQTAQDEQRQQQLQQAQARQAEMDAINQAMTARTLQQQNVGLMQGQDPTAGQGQNVDVPGVAGSPAIPGGMMNPTDVAPTAPARFAAMPIGGVPQLGVEGVQVRPQSAQEAQAAAEQAARQHSDQIYSDTAARTQATIDAGGGPKPKLYPVTVPGPDGKPVQTLVTEDQMRRGVRTYEKQRPVWRR